MPFQIVEATVVNEVTLAPSAVLYEGAVLADGDLSIKVNAFYYVVAGLHGRYVGVVGQAVTDDATNYVYMDATGMLVVNASGYPATATHVRLARVIAAGGIIVRIVLERAFFGATDPSGVPASRQIIAGSGLTGGGDLSVDRTLAVVNQTNLLRVSVDGAGANYSSVAAACAYAASNPSSVFCILLGPGTYTESPFTIPSNACVRGLGVWDEVVIATNNNSADFISIAASGVLAHCGVVGPTGSGFAAIDYQGTGYAPAFLYHVVIHKGFYGVHVHPASYGSIHCHEVVNRYSGSAINQFFRVANGNMTAMTCSFMSGPSASVVTGYYVTGAAATLTLDNCAFRCPGSTDGLLADNGAHVRLSATTFSAGTTAIHVGSTGTGTEVHAAGCVIDDSFTTDIKTDTPNCIIAYSGKMHRVKVDLAAGTTYSANYTDDTSGVAGGVIGGELWLEQGAGTAFPLGGYARATSRTGLVSGGDVIKTSGLGVSTAAGVGYIRTDVQVLKIEWGVTPLTLTASKSESWIVVDDTGTVQEVLFEPDNTLVIVLASCATSATNVVFMATRFVELVQNSASSNTYARDVVGPISVSGSGVTKYGGTSLQFQVDAGVFYVMDNRRASAASGAPATFTYWYRNSPSGWKQVTGQTSIDAVNYDNGSGTLQAMTAGKYKRDLVYESVNGSGTEFHVLYGQTQFDTAELAISNPTPPDVLLNTGLRLAAIIVLKSAADIASIADQRPKLGQLSAAGSAVSVHGALSGLSADDHAQYQLRTEKGAISGYCGLDAGQKVAAGNLNITANPPANVTKAAAAVGASTELARQDHKHDVTTAVRPMRRVQQHPWRGRITSMTTERSRAERCTRRSSQPVPRGL
jgi:hypothetical protein